MPLEPQAFSSAHPELVAAPTLTHTTVVLPVVETSLIGLHSEAPVSEHSPPDLNVLHSTFLI
jgi:hypothetical protein